MQAKLADYERSQHGSSVAAESTDDLDAEVAATERRILGLKRQLLLNDERIAKLLHMVVSGRS